MKLSKYTEEFLKYILEKKPQDFVAVDIKELPDHLKNQIFGFADELEEAGLIKNPGKFGNSDNRGLTFFLLPRGLSYFEEKVERENLVPTSTTNVNGHLVIGSGNIVAGTSVQIEKLPDNKKKGWFEKYGFKLIIAIIGAAAMIFAALIGIPYVRPTPILTPIPTTSPIIITQSVTSDSEPTTDKALPVVSNGSTLCSFSNGPITVGVIDLRPNYAYEDIFDRLAKIGLAPSWVSADSDYFEFKKYDVVYLPTGWSIVDSKLELYPKFLNDYVKKGGGLLVEQPNSKKELIPAFLPYPITYMNAGMNREDWPLIIFDSSFSLTSGLDVDELSGPMECAEIDPSYAPIVKGSKTGCTSLAVTSYGDGRILISMGNASPSMEEGGYPMISDEALCRMFGWVSKEFIR